MMAKQPLPQQLLIDFVSMRLDAIEHQRVLDHLAEHEADLLRVEALWESEVSVVPNPPASLRKRIFRQTIQTKTC